MIKTELLAVPDTIYEPTQTVYRDINWLNSKLLEEGHGYHFITLLEKADADPETVLRNLINYMVPMFELYRRKAEDKYIDPATRQLLGEIALNFRTVFQETKEETVAALMKFCTAQGKLAMTNDDLPTFHRWSLVLMSLQRFARP